MCCKATICYRFVVDHAVMFSQVCCMCTLIWSHEKICNKSAKYYRFGTAYCIWSVIFSFSNLNRWSSSLGLFYHVPLKRDQGDWNWRLRYDDTPNAIGFTEHTVLFSQVFVCLIWSNKKMCDTSAIYDRFVAELNVMRRQVCVCGV